MNCIIGLFAQLSTTDKILDWSNLKAVAEDNLNIAQTMIPVFDRLENNAGKQHFLPFPQCFQKRFLSLAPQLFSSSPSFNVSVIQVFF